MKQKMMEALKSGMNAAAFQQLEKIMKNPSQSGIDVKAPVFVFTSKTFISPTIVAKVSNIEDLRASLDLMAKEGICQPIAEEEGYSFTSLQKNNLLVFNENAAVLTEAYGTSQMDVAKQTISTLLKQTEENSIASNGSFPEDAGSERRHQLFCFNGCGSQNVYSTNQSGTLFTNRLE